MQRVYETTWSNSWNIFLFGVWHVDQTHLRYLYYLLPAAGRVSKIDFLIRLKRRKTRSEEIIVLVINNGSVQRFVIVVQNTRIVWPQIRMFFINNFTQSTHNTQIMHNTVVIEGIREHHHLSRNVLNMAFQSYRAMILKVGRGGEGKATKDVST